MTTYPSKSTMRREVMKEGGYFSETGQWCFVHERWGAQYFPTLEDAHDALLKSERTGRHICAPEPDALGW